MRIPRRILVSLAMVTLAGLALIPVPGRPAAASSLPRVTFTAGPDGSILVHGIYPATHSSCVRKFQPLLHARFTGTIEVSKDTDASLFVVGSLPFEDYLQGIGEMPRSWPMEALKAQAVAARTYALSRVGSPDATGTRLGYQLCATDACQVYLGLGVADGPYGNRWRTAVHQTAGQALQYGGRPADTLYFSTSNGHTLGNDQVFGAAPVPYLRPVTEHDDGASSVSHWRSVIPLTDVGRFLRAAGDWGSGSVSLVRRSGSNVVVSGPGASRTVSVSEFRSDLDSWGPCLAPNVYPGLNRDNGTSLPQTVPSVWFSLSTAGGAAVIEGRGWGHGVGMVQWGAYGKAQRGLSYSDILAAYYGGLRPVSSAEPATIRVGIALGLKTVQIAGTGPVSVSGGGPSTGPWTISGGSRLTVRGGPAPPTYISAGTLDGPKHARAGNELKATLTLPQLSVARLVFPTSTGDVPVGPGRTEYPGRVELTGRVPDYLPSGTYPLEAVVTNGIDIVRARAPATVIVTGGPSPAPSPSPSPVLPQSPSSIPVAAAPVSGGGRGPLVVLVAVAVLALAGGAFELRRRRRRARIRAGAQQAGAGPEAPSS